MSSGEYTKAEQRQINQTIVGIFKTLEYNRIPTNVGAAALMIATARITALADHDDAYLVEQFRLCLADARINPKGVDQ